MNTAPVAQTTSATDDQVEFYHEQGYLVVKDALTTDEVDSLNREAAAICRGDRGTFAGWAGPHEGQSDDQVMQQYLCIHFPHKCSDLIRDAVCHPVFRDVLSRIVSPNVKCMQSMLFIKAAGKPGQAWHQDEIYIPTRDRSLTGGWIALDDATIDNGCLWVIPGSHRPGILWPQREHEDRRFDCAHETYRYPYTDDDAIPVEVTAGSVVFFNGYLLHRSLPNRKTTGYRRALVNHYMSAESLLPWYGPDRAAAEPIARADNRDIIMVCGEDPYAWNPIEDRSKPTVRPSGEGGCQSWGKKEKDPAED